MTDCVSLRPEYLLLDGSDEGICLEEDVVLLTSLKVHMEDLVKWMVFPVIESLNKH